MPDGFQMRGRLADFTTAPLDGARVEIAPEPLAWRLAGPAAIAALGVQVETTDEEGTFQLNMVPGRYRFRVFMPDGRRLREFVDFAPNSWLVLVDAPENAVLDGGAVVMDDGLIVVDTD